MGGREKGTIHGTPFSGLKSTIRNKQQSYRRYENPHAAAVACDNPLPKTRFPPTTPPLTYTLQPLKDATV